MTGDGFVLLDAASHTDSLSASMSLWMSVTISMFMSRPRTTNQDR